jgi:hypothetical protein
MTNNNTYFKAEQRVDMILDKKRNQTLREVITRRNNWMLEMFSEVPYTIILIGNAETPALVIDTQERIGIKLSAYPHNFNLYFTNKPHDGELVEVFKINLTTKISVPFFEDFIKNCEQETSRKRRPRKYTLPTKLGTKKQ